MFKRSWARVSFPIPIPHIQLQNVTQIHCSLLNVLGHHLAGLTGLPALFFLILLCPTQWPHWVTSLAVQRDSLAPNLPRPIRSSPPLPLPSLTFRPSEEMLSGDGGRWAQPPRVSGNLGGSPHPSHLPSPAGTTHMAPVPSLTWEGGLLC